MENKKDEQKALQYQGIKITGRLIETSNQYNINFNNEHITSSVITNIVNVPPDDIHEKLLEDIQNSLNDGFLLRQIRGEKILGNELKSFLRKLKDNELTADRLEAIIQVTIKGWNVLEFIRVEEDANEFFKFLLYELEDNLVQELLLNVDEQGFNILHYLGSKGRFNTLVQLVKQIFEKEWNPDYVNSFLLSTTNKKRNILHIVYKNRNHKNNSCLDVLKMLNDYLKDPKDEISRMIIAKPKKAFNVLLTCCSYQNIQEISCFMDWIFKNLYIGDITDWVQTRNSQNQNFAQIIALKDNPKQIISLVQKDLFEDPEILEFIVTSQDDNKCHLLYTLMDSTSAFLDILQMKDLRANILEKAFLIPVKNDRNLLDHICENMVVFKKTIPVIIKSHGQNMSRILFHAQDHNRETILIKIVNKHKTRSIMEILDFLIETMDKNFITDWFKIPNAMNENFLRQISYYGVYDELVSWAFKNLDQGFVESNFISDPVKKMTTIFHEFDVMNAETFIRKFKMLEQNIGLNSLKEVLLKRNENGDTFLHSLSQNCEGYYTIHDIIKTFLEKFDKKFVTNIFLMQNDLGKTFFHQGMESNLHYIFFVTTEGIVRKYDENLAHQLMTMRALDGSTILHAACKNKTFTALFNEERLLTEILDWFRCHLVDDDLRSFLMATINDNKSTFLHVFMGSMDKYLSVNFLFKLSSTKNKITRDVMLLNDSYGNSFVTKISGKISGECLIDFVKFIKQHFYEIMDALFTNENQDGVSFMGQLHKFTNKDFCNYLLKEVIPLGFECHFELSSLLYVDYSLDKIHLSTLKKIFCFESSDLMPKSSVSAVSEIPSKTPISQELIGEAIASINASTSKMPPHDHKLSSVSDQSNKSLSVKQNLIGEENPSKSEIQPQNTQTTSDSEVSNKFSVRRKLIGDENSFLTMLLNTSNEETFTQVLSSFLNDFGTEAIKGLFIKEKFLSSFQKSKNRPFEIKVLLETLVSKFTSDFVFTLIQNEYNIFQLTKILDDSKSPNLLEVYDFLQHLFSDETTKNILMRNYNFLERLTKSIKECESETEYSEDFKNLEKRFGTDFIKELLMGRHNQDKRSLLHRSYAEYPKCNITKGIKLLKYKYGDKFVETLLMCKDTSNNTFLFRISQLKILFDTVKFLKNEFKGDLIRNLIEVKNKYDNNFVVHFEHCHGLTVQIFLVDYWKFKYFMYSALDNDYSKLYLNTFKHINCMTVLHQLAIDYERYGKSFKKTTFFESLESLWNAMANDLDEFSFDKVLFDRSYEGKTFLHIYCTNFSELLPFLKSKLPVDKLKMLLNTKDNTGNTFLQTFGGESLNAFCEHLKLLQDEFDEEFMKSLMISRNDNGETFLHTLSHVITESSRLPMDFTYLEQSRVDELLSLHFDKNPCINILSLYKTESESKTLFTFFNKIFDAKLSNDLQANLNNAGETYIEGWNKHNLNFTSRMIKKHNDYRNLKTGFYMIKDNKQKDWISFVSSNSSLLNSFQEMLRSDSFKEFATRLFVIHPMEEEGV